MWAASGLWPVRSGRCPAILPSPWGPTDGAADETKARYAFVYGDFRRIHRTGLIACQYRAAEWRHKAVELAAHDLLQHLDRISGVRP
jgi:hypothetical protein